MTIDPDLAIVVVASVDHDGAGDADAYGPFATEGEADLWAEKVPMETTGDGGYPPRVFVYKLADLTDPDEAWWLEDVEDEDEVID